MSGNSAAATVQKKKVRFGRAVQIEVESYKSCAATIWWTKQEVREIEEESDTIIHFMNMMTKSAVVDSSNTADTGYPPEVDAAIHAIRGLEKRTEIGAWEMYETQRDARNAVLNQQDKNKQKMKQLQRGNKKIPISSEQIHEMAEAIANVYRIATFKARRAAYEVALKDRKEAKREVKGRTSTNNNTNNVSNAPPLVRQSSKIILVTSEPIHPKWGRKISMPLMDEATKQPEQSQSQRVGSAPVLRSCISPMKKSRQKISDVELSSTIIETSTPSKLTSSATPLRKRITIFDLEHLRLQDDTPKSSKNNPTLDTDTEKFDNMKVTPSRKNKKKIVVSCESLEKDDMLKMFNDSTNRILLKSTKVKKVKTGVIVKKKKKSVQSKEEDSNEMVRKVPSRANSTDHTVETEPMFDHSSSSSFDESSSSCYDFDMNASFVELEVL